MKLTDIKITGHLSNEEFKEQLVKMTSESKYTELSIDNVVRELTYGYSTVLEDGVFILKVLYKSFLIIYESGHVCIFTIGEDTLEILNLTIGVCRIVVTPLDKVYKHVFDQIIKCKEVLSLDDIKLITGGMVFKSFCSFDNSDIGDRYDNARSILLYKASVTEKLDINFQNLLFRQLLSSILNDGYGNYALEGYVDSLTEFVACLQDTDFSQQAMQSKLLEMTMKTIEKL